MANQYGTDREFKVYKLMSAGQVGAFETYYGLVYVKSFPSYEEAEKWILDDGDRQVNYTIIEVFRNK